MEKADITTALLEKDNHAIPEIELAWFATAKPTPECSR